MALTVFEARSSGGELLSLPLGDISEGFSVQNITGLDPVPATIVSNAYATQDGERYHSSRRSKRNIVVTLGLEPDFSTGSARKLRDILYNFFMPKSEVSLRFVSDDEATVDILGRIETFDAPLFTDKPQATISILCFLPDFIDVNSTHVTGNSVNDMTEQIINYDGSVETGMVFNLLVGRAITEFSIKNRPGDNLVRSMDFTASLIPGDVLEVNTNPGSRGVHLIRATVRSSLLYSLSPYSPWIELYPGDNGFRVVAGGDPIPYFLDYTNHYGGL